MRFLLSGYYGFGNLGDEALLEVITSQLRTRFPYCQIDVLSADPERTAHELRVEATPRADLRRVRDAIARADVVLSGGGGLLQNATSLRSLLYYAGVIRSAIRARRATLIFAQSIGPLDFWGRRIVRDWCKGLSGATVRDARSEKLLASLLPQTRIERTADPVFLYEPRDVDLSVEGLGHDGEPLVVVSVRKSSGMKEGIAVVARSVDRLASIHNARVAFLPIGGASDAEIATQIIRKCKSAPMLLPEMPLERAAAVIRRAHAVIGMRLHALILAARFGVPFAAIPYDPKVTSLCDDLAYPLPALFDPAHARPAEATTDAIVDRLWLDREVLAEHLRTAYGPVRQLAQRNFDVISEIARENVRSS